MTTLPGAYVADFENSVPKSDLYTDEYLYDDGESTADLQQGNKIEATKVWAFALCPISDNPSPNDVTIVNNIEDALFDICANIIVMKGKRYITPKVFFHNLGYDGRLILSALLNAGYEHTTRGEGERKPQNHTFWTTISDDGVFYSITVTFDNNRTVEFRDSLKLLPFTVDQIGKSLKTKAKKLKGTIDYAADRDDDYKITDTEKKYIQNDVLVMAEALYKLETEFPGYLKSSTIGSACMKFFYGILAKNRVEGMDSLPIEDVPENLWSDFERIGKDIWKEEFSEVLDQSQDAELRKAYRGGFCYVNRDNSLINNNQIVKFENGKNGHVYDVNSLYPSSMYNKVFPFGVPIEVNPDRNILDIEKPYIIKMNANFKVKTDHVPFIQIKGTGRFAENEYISDSNGIEEITLTKPAFELFTEQYDIIECEIIKLWVFEEIRNPFNDYIDHWYKIKDEATNNKNFVMRTIAKLFLNNLYGKMAQNALKTTGIPALNDNGIITIEAGQEEYSAGGFIPIGAFITDYARCVTIRAAQNNFDIFLYADTDSLHTSGEAVGIEIDPNKLGAWDEEARFTIGRYTRQKTYIEQICYSDGEYLDATYTDIKACGANALVKERLMYNVSKYTDNGWRFKRIVRDENDKPINERKDTMEIFKAFQPGLKEAGKLSRRSVVGGTWLVETTFSIHGDSLGTPAVSVVR